ncbi:alpha/beta hydrolase family esterase [Roseovarius sp. S1116L3]|uniref:extracellular catalytic domain type 1 short-chain-length polyhydroxyalkanoate depolymerase n=1 Tax=Roseovarius roseus TaxID=3342636 RepID=UPI003B67D72E
MRMYDPFKRMRSRMRRNMQRATSKAMSDAWDAVVPAAKPKKRKAAEPARPVDRGPRPAASPQRRSGSRSVSKPHPQPRGAVFAAATYTCDFGTRPFRLYTPASAKRVTGPLPLIVMLHGCGQSPEGFAKGTDMNHLAEEFGFLVLYPGQTRDAHAGRCWNWFRASDQRRGAGEPALIASLTHSIMSERQVDPAKVYIAGLSAGASLALITAVAYPDIFAAVGAHSGLSVGAAHDAPSATNAMQHGAAGRRHVCRMPTILFHGGADRVVNPRNGRLAALRATEPFGGLQATEKTLNSPHGRDCIRTIHRIGKGRPYVEHWLIKGSGHGWSGGAGSASYTDPTGPDASREMVRFFLRHRTTKQKRRSK